VTISSLYRTLDFAKKVIEDETGAPLPLGSVSLPAPGVPESDAEKKLIYIPNGGEGNVTVVHQDSPDKYSTVATIPTFAGAKTITVDPMTHNVYLFQPERGPVPPPWDTNTLPPRLAEPLLKSVANSRT
jgi:hypothetical protein